MSLLSVLVCTGFILYSVRPALPFQADGARLTQVTVEQASGAPARLSEAVAVRCSGGAGQFDVVFTIDGKARRKEHLERDGTFYCLATAPLRVMLHERYASDEDRLIVYDLSRNEGKPFYLSHDEPSDYAHQHFSVRSITKEQITVEEQQYAGSAKPRHRQVVLTIRDSMVAVERGRWTTDE